VLQHKFADAQAVLTSAMDRWKRSGAPAWRVARSANSLGEALYRQQHNEEAERYLVESYRELSADPAADRDSRRIAHERIARFYTERGQRQKLDALLAEYTMTRG
jgi:eukaryotic-like serine/threonine-protein kinase